MSAWMQVVNDTALVTVFVFITMLTVAGNFSSIPSIARTFIPLPIGTWSMTTPFSIFLIFILSCSESIKRNNPLVHPRTESSIAMRTGMPFASCAK